MQDSKKEKYPINPAKEPYAGMRKLPERIGGFPISFRAFGILAYASVTETKISCKELVLRGSEGRDAIYSALTELRQMGFIETTSVKMSSRWVKATLITEKGESYLENLGVPYKSFHRKSEEESKQYSVVIIN